MELNSMRDRASLLALGLSILAHVLIVFGLSTSPAWKSDDQVTVIHVELKSDDAELLSTTPNMHLPVAQSVPVQAADEETDAEKSNVDRNPQPVAKPIQDLSRPVPELEKITELLTTENLEDYCRSRSQKEADRYANQPDIPGKGVVHDPCIQG
jgi:hypothetical protein